MKAEHDQLKAQIKCLQEELGVSDDSCNEEAFPDDLEVEMKIEIEEESIDDYTSSDNEND